MLSEWEKVYKMLYNRSRIVLHYIIIHKNMGYSSFPNIKATFRDICDRKLWVQEVKNQLNTFLKLFILKIQNIAHIYKISHIMFCYQWPTFIFLPSEKVRDSNISGLSKHRGARYCAGQAGKFCLCVGNQANKRADGTMEHAEPQPITEDEFCVLGNLLKIQNC